MCENVWQCVQKVQKEQNLTFPTLTNDLWSDSTKSILRYVIYVILKKLHAKKEKIT